VKRRRLIRVAAVVLLAWIAVDLSAIDTCALDMDVGPVVPSASAPAFQAPAPPAHPHAVLHPDHCFCHGLSVGPGTAGRLSKPLSATARIAEISPGHSHWTTSVLDHPPKTFA
jgi:hypothetical protein